MFSMTSPSFNAAMVTGKRKLDFSEKKMKTKLSKRLERLEKRKLNKRKSRQTKSKMARLARETQQHEQQQQQQQEETIKSEPSVVEVPNRPPKPVFNSEGRMVFSKFDFGGLTAPTSSSMLSATRTKSNDPKAALRKLHKVHQTLERLEADGRTEQAHQITEQRAWDGAIQRSEGVKVSLWCWPYASEWLQMVGWAFLEVARSIHLLGQHTNAAVVDGCKEPSTDGMLQGKPIHPMNSH